MSTNKPQLDTSVVRELAAILREADLGEVEVELEGLRIRVSKPAAPVVQAPTVYAPPATAVAAPAPQTAAAAPQAPAAAPEASANSITSPMVGTVYMSPDPSSKPFFNVGDKVNKGDTIMLIEAMKTFNPVEADRSGTLTKFYVSDAQPVEFGEALALIE